MSSSSVSSSSSSLPSSLSNAKFSTLQLSLIDSHILHVSLSNGSMNAMSSQFFQEFHNCFKIVGQETSIRCVIISGSKNSKMFTAGLDLKEAANFFGASDMTDPSRIAYKHYKNISEIQQTFSVLERIPQPVICAIHSMCIGGGVDLITAADIRICTQDASFVIKEVDIGLAADLGTLQRVSRVIGSRSLVNELALTCRPLSANEAKECGLVSAVVPDRESLIPRALVIAKAIAERSPVAITGTKHLLLKTRDMTVNEGLDYTAVWMRPCSKLAIFQLQSWPQKQNRNLSSRIFRKFCSFMHKNAVQ